MLLTGLVFIAAIVLEILGSFMSVVGLSSKSSLVLIILAISLDFSKVITASVLYKNWKELNFSFKLFLVPTTLFLMVITSYGAYAYLLQEFSKTTATGEQMAVQISSLEEESNKLNTRKKEIDSQIAAVDPSLVTQKRRLNTMFEKELVYINERTIQLDREIPALKLNKMSDNLQAGTLGSLAKAWGTTTEEASRIIALMMVFVIDPLAIVLLMVGNFLQIKNEKEKIKKLASVSEEEENIDDNWISQQIIPTSHPLAQKARDILERHKKIVGKNAFDDEINNVELPTQNNPNPQGLIYSGKLPNTYVRKINDIVIQADTKGGLPEIINELNRVKNILKNPPPGATWSNIL
jgi:Flp pilus assembly protein TadB